LLDAKPRRRVWYVLEGRTQPDACLESETFLLVLEGKRTERKATSSTTWLPRRSQILRHMDAAFEISEGRRVFGLMIVEGPGGADSVTPSAYWLNQAEEEISDSSLSASLPHRTVAERAHIAEGFLGVTTWQAVCKRFGLPWPPS